MNKKVIAGILCAVIVVAGGAVVIVNRKAADKSEKIALLGKSADNAFFENAARSFQETVEAEGGTADVFYPDSATADAQSKILNDLLDQDYDAICISANDVNALQAGLQNYPDLKVICSPTTVGIAAAAKYIQENGESCKLTGLGLPSEMLDYTGRGRWKRSCPWRTASV